MSCCQNAEVTVKLLKLSITAVLPSPSPLMLNGPKRPMGTVVDQGVVNLDKSTTGGTGVDIEEAGLEINVAAIRPAAGATEQDGVVAVVGADLVDDRGVAHEDGRFGCDADDVVAEANATGGVALALFERHVTDDVRAIDGDDVTQARGAAHEGEAGALADEDVVGGVQVNLATQSCRNPA